MKSNNLLYRILGQSVGKLTTKGVIILLKTIIILLKRIVILLK